MGKATILFKVYTEAGNEQKVSDEIKKVMNPKGMQLEDLAFGIKVIKVLFMYEAEDGSSSIEEALKKVNGVTQVEVEEESLL